MTSNQPKKSPTVVDKDDDKKPKRKDTSQISVRIAQELYDELYSKARDEDLSVTDIVERGVQLALAEHGYELKPALQSRYVFWRQTPQAARRGMLFTLWSHYSKLSPEMQMLRNFIFELLQQFSGQPKLLNDAYDEFRKGSSRMTTVSGKDRA